MDLFDLLSRHEGAGNPSTLFGHAQLPGRQFAGVDVSKMTLGELREFASPNGDYGRWVKDELGRAGQQPRIATPMGVGQIVGTTLRNTQSQLGLSDDTVFDEGTQRDMVLHLAKNRIVPGNDQATLRGLRQEWEGFKHVDDDVLLAAAKGIGDPSMGPTQEAADKGSVKSGPLGGFATAMRETAQEATRAALEAAGIDTSKYEGKSKEGERAIPQIITPYSKMGMGTMNPQDPRAAVAAAQKNMGSPSGAPYQHTPFPVGTPVASPNQVKAGAGGTSTAAGGAATDRVTHAGASNMGTPAAGATGAATPANSPSSEEEQKQSFSDKVAEFLFPNQENPRETLGNALTGLGIGFSQMAHGQPVNLQPHFQGIADRRQAVIDNKMAAEQQALDNQIRLGSLQVQQGQLEVAQGKLISEQTKAAAAAQPGGGIFSPADIETFRTDPVFSQYLPWLQSSDPATVRKGGEAIIDEQQRRLEEGGESPEFSDAYRVWSDPSASVDDKAAAIIGMPAEDVTRLGNLVGADPTALTQNSQEYLDALENNPPLARAMEAMMDRQAGIDETPKERANREGAQRREDAYTDTYIKGARITSELLNLRDLTNKMIEEGTESTEADGLMSRIYGGLRLTMGNDAAHYVADKFGINITDNARMNQTEKTLALLIAQPMMEGGGSISDSERKGMLEMIAGGGTTHGARLMMIEKMLMLNKVDGIMAGAYSAGLKDDNSNQRPLDNQIKLSAAEVLPELSRAAQANSELVNHRRIAEFSYLGDYSPERKFDHVAPILTAGQYSMFKEAVPYSPTTRDQFWRRRNPDGTITRMKNGSEWKP